MSQALPAIRAGAAWLAEAMRARGIETAVLETGGSPVVYGERRVPGAARTLLLYGHYDVKPAPPEGWLQPSPFEPVLRRGLAEDGAAAVPLEAVDPVHLAEHRLYARGAADDKGPIWAHLTALELMDAVGLAPAVHLKLLFEGEEEIGSPSLAAFVGAHRDRLQADVALLTDGPQHASGRPTVAFGARGILALELTLEGARRDVHSGHTVAPSPAWRLVGLLATMAMPDGTPLVPALLRDVLPPTPAEEALLAAIPFDREALARDLGVPVPADALERIMLRPTLNIRGLACGSTGDQAQTVIPHRATAALEARLVPNQRAEAVYRGLLAHIRAQGFEVLESADAPLPEGWRGRVVRVTGRHGYDPARTPVDLPVSRRVIEVVERAHGGVPAVVLPTLGGSVPLGAFTETLGIPAVVVPYANADNRQHAPNEHLRLDHLFQGVRTTARLLAELTW